MRLSLHTYRMLATQEVEAVGSNKEQEVEDLVNIDSSLMEKTEQFRASLRGALPKRNRG